MTDVPAQPVVALGDGGAVDLPAPHDAGVGTRPRGASRDAVWSLTVLLLIYILSMFARNIVTMLVPEMKATLKLSDFQLGLVLGPAFSLSYSISSLPLGWLADRFSRRWILLSGTVLFGLATIATGFAGGFVALLLVRILVGVGEASLGPASGSLLAAKVPRRRLATAISVYSTGTKLGTSIAYAVAGVGLTTSAALIAAWHVPGLASWQMFMVLGGAPAILVALLMLTVSEPPRPPAKAGDKPQNIFAFIMAERALLLPLIVGFSLMALCANSLVGWVPAYIHRHFHMTKEAYGSVLGLYSMGAAVTLFFKGMLVDWLYQRGVKDAHVRFYWWIVAASTPCAMALFLVSNVSLFFVLLAVVQVIAVPVTSYAATVMQVITPPELRGQMSAAAALCLVTIGGLGPSAVGMLTDFVFHDEALVGRSLACVTIATFPLVLLFLGLSLRPLRKRVLAVEAEIA